MKRINPPAYCEGLPCSIVAVLCATKGKYNPDVKPILKGDGYATLAEANCFIRKSLSVKKRIDYRRGERPKLIDLHLSGKAVVCVYGHYLYLEDET